MDANRLFCDSDHAYFVIHCGDSFCVDYFRAWFDGALCLTQEDCPDYLSIVVVRGRYRGDCLSHDFPLLSAIIRSKVELKAAVPGINLPVSATALAAACAWSLVAPPKVAPAYV